MAEKCNTELFILVAADGEYAVGATEEAALTSFEENIGALNKQDGFRLVKVTVAVPLPTIPELAGEAPTEGDAELTRVA
jgi:hypothetical protein